MNNLDKMFEQQKDPAAYAKGYLSYLTEVLKSLDINSIASVMKVFDDTRKKGRHIYFIGNGGSAATASHFANDFTVGMRFPQCPFKVVSLTDNVAILTAVGNDEGYDQIFVKQLEVLLEPGDVVVGISASGNSPNLVKAMEYANSKGNMTISFTGFTGGKMKEMTKMNIHVPSMPGEYGPVEDVHMVLDHLMGTYFFRALRA